MPFNNLSLQTTLPHQLNQPDPIPALFRLNSNLSLPSNCIPEVLIEAEPVAWDRGVSTGP